VAFPSNLAFPGSLSRPRPNPRDRIRGYQLLLKPCAYLSFNASPGLAGAPCLGAASRTCQCCSACARRARRLRGTGTRWPSWQRLEDGQRLVDAELHLRPPPLQRRMAQTLEGSPGPGRPAALSSWVQTAVARRVAFQLHPVAWNLCREQSRGPRQEHGQLVRVPAECRLPDKDRQAPSRGRQRKGSHNQPMRQMRRLCLDASTGLNIWYVVSPDGLSALASHGHRQSRCSLGCRL